MVTAIREDVFSNFLLKLNDAPFETFPVYSQVKAVDFVGERFIRRSY